MSGTMICPHCGSKHVEKVSDFFVCQDCHRDFGRDFFTDEGIPVKESITDIRFRYGDVISGSVRAHFLQDENQCVYEVYDSYGGGVDKVADVMSRKEWEEFKRKLVEDLYVFDWDKVYYPANDGREIRGNNEWELNIGVGKEEEYTFKGVDAYPAYWNRFTKILEPYINKLKK